ncbi:MAG: beta-lactamase family protein [Negativicutes bacterium]|nr:beta-lactamase family protein [Negativicutes bacterium]
MNQLSEKLNGILKMNLAKNYTSVSYAILKNGELLAAGAIGNSGGPHKKPSTIHDTYNVASISKIYSTLAVMKLVEQGKVSLDEPIVKYLPRFRMPDERYRLITLRHCLSHTSGLPGTQWKGFSVSDTTDAHYYDDVYDYLSYNYLKANPGEYAVYCNDGFTMAELVVAEVSGIRFSAFCEQFMMQPLAAATTKFSEQLTGENTLVSEGGKPAELLLIQGAAGITTSMPDLCKLGQMILHPGELFLPSSLEEMAKPHGVSFLTEDDRSTSFGLGWDNVNMQDPEYDLGEGVLQKGGNSFQFNSQFIVIPKFEAVLAISATHDCKCDVSETILRLFAVALLEEGINIYQKQKLIPQEMIGRYAGLYLLPNAIYQVHLYATTCNITHDTTRGESEGVYKNLKFNGNVFEAADGQTFYFNESKGSVYLITNLKGRRIPLAQKAANYPAISAAWQKRLGKQYIVIDASPYDLVIRDIATGLQVASLPDHSGILIASLSARDDSEIYGVFEGSFVPATDEIGKGFINTPANGSRDLLFPCFEVKNGIEYCHVASYLYRDVATLADYCGQGFHQGRINQVYRLKEELSSLPEVPNGRRLFVLNKDMSVVYDSLSKDSFKPVKEGYISFI